MVHILNKEKAREKVDILLKFMNNSAEKPYFFSLNQICI